MPRLNLCRGSNVNLHLLLLIAPVALGTVLAFQQHHSQYHHRQHSRTIVRSPRLHPSSQTIHNIHYTFINNVSVKIQRGGRLPRSSSPRNPTTTTTLQALSLPFTPQSPLLSPQDQLGNIAILTTTASLSHQLGKTTSVGKLLGPPVTAMAIAFLLGSIGILPPGGSTGAKFLQLTSIQLATPMLLLGVNLRECRKRCGPLLRSFVLAAAATIGACMVAFPICDGGLYRALGDDGVKIAAALMAKNVGGGLNYVAVCRSLDASANAIAAGLCVDNIFALIYFPLTSALAAGREDIKDDGKDRGHGKKSQSVVLKLKKEEKSSSVERREQETINAERISATLTVATIATWLGESIGGTSGALPLATCFTILFTVLCPRIASSLSSSGEALGTSLLYLFFATAGAPGLAIADSVKASFLPIGLFLTMLYGIHGFILVLTRNLMLWKQNRIGSESSELDQNSALLPQRLLVASSAAIGGPATAAALAKANKWDSLVAPSLIVGNLGYAIATFCGIAFHAFYSNQ